MNPVVGKAYQVAPDWFVALKSARRAIVLKRQVRENENYERGNRYEGPKMFVEYVTARPDAQENGFDDHWDPAKAIRQGEWAPWPGAWSLNPNRGYETLLEAVEGIHFSDLDTLFDFDFDMLIKLLGHDGAYASVSPDEPASVAAYWAAAAKRVPTPALIEQHLTDNFYWRQWALRLAYVHGRPLSSMEMVEFCTSETQTMREFALTVTPGEATTPTPGRKTRSR